MPKVFESSVNLQGTKTIAFTASVRIAKNKRGSESSHKYAAKHDITPSETSDTARIPTLLKVSTMLIPLIQETVSLSTVTKHLGNNVQTNPVI